MLIPFDFRSAAASRLYRRNRTALADVAGPALAAIQAGASAPPPLIADSAFPDRPIDLQVQGCARFFGGDTRTISRRQVEDFVTGDYPFVPPVVSYSPEDEVVYQRICSLDRDFGEPLMVSPRPYVVPRRYGPILVVCGIGLGWHVEALLERYDVLDLIICETEPALFHASLYAIDWTKTVKQFASDDRHLAIIVDSDPDRAIGGVLAALERRNRALAVGARFFRHYQSPRLNAVTDAVGRALPLLSFGWGYFKDERRQALQAEQNIQSGYSWLGAQGKTLGDVRAVVVGSGPSLDGTISILKAIRHKVVLFSVGSSLRVLARASLIPDFHVELETAPVVMDVLGEIGQREIFERVTLLAAHSISPDVARSFRRTILFARENSLSSTLLGKDAEAVSGAIPVAGNAAVGLAARLGFARVLLLGMDFGYRDPERHHAVGTIYVDEETGLARDLAEVNLGHLNESNLNYADTRHVLTSIRGDRLLAENILWTSHLVMERLLRDVPGLRLTQCGEGARIAGAENVLPENFKAEDDQVDLAAVLAKIETRFTAAPIDAEEYRRRLLRLASAYEDLALDLRKVFERHSVRLFSYATLIDTAWRRVEAAQSDASPLIHLVTGIFTSYFKATIERSMMTGSVPDQRRFIALAQSHFVALLDDVSAALEPFRSAPASQPEPSKRLPSRAATVEEYRRPPD